MGRGVGQIYSSLTPFFSELFEYTLTGHLFPLALAQLLARAVLLCFILGKDSCYVWKAQDVSRSCAHCATESIPPGTSGCSYIFLAVLVGRVSVEITSMAGIAKAGSLQIHQYMCRIPDVQWCIEKTHPRRMKYRSTSVICMPCFGTINTTGSSPSRASGTATAAQDSTRPYSYNAFSMETGS